MPIKKVKSYKFKVKKNYMTYQSMNSGAPKPHLRFTLHEIRRTTLC